MTEGILVNARSLAGPAKPWYDCGMSDPRIVDYLKQNQGKYPLDALKAALVKQGFPMAEVEEAAQAASGMAPPPPVLGGGPGSYPEGGYVSFGLGRMVANAAGLFKDPAAFFGRFDPELPFGAPLFSIVAWGVFSGVLTFLMAIVKPSPFGMIAAGIQVIMIPVMAAILSFVGTGVFHVLCLILGGKGSFKASYQVIAAMAALFPISTLLGAVPFGTLPIQVYGLYLSVQAAAAVHTVGKTKAWVLFGLLTAFGVVGSIMAQIGMRDFERRAAATGMAQPGMPNAAPGAIPAQAAQMLGQLGGQATPEVQQAMQQAMQNPGAILQELTKYGNLAEPPQETLALLDPSGQARLRKSWAQLSAPMRKSMVETLPSVPAADRNGFMDQMDSYTKDINATLNQSMQMLNQAMQQGAPTKKH